MTMMDELFIEMEKQLTELGISTIRDKQVDEGYLKIIEERFKVSFPEGYRQFLLRYGNSSFEQDIQFRAVEKTSWSNDNNLGSFGSFFVIDDETNNLENRIEQYYDRMPTLILPIADDSAGNLICIGVKDKYQGKIYFWDHEDELVAKIMLNEEVQGKVSIDDYWENVYLIANSFFEFISSLEIEKEEKVEGINSKIIGINMSNDFLEKMRLARERLEAKEKGEGI